LTESADDDLVVRTDANRLPVGTVARLFVVKDIDGRVADDVIESGRGSSFSLVFIAAPLKTGDDLPNLLSSFPHIPGNVEFCICGKDSRICVGIQCVERRPVTHDQNLYVQFILKPLLRVALGRTCLRSSGDRNHDDEQDQSDRPKYPHSSSRRRSSHTVKAFHLVRDLIYLVGLVK